MNKGKLIQLQIPGSEPKNSFKLPDKVLSGVNRYLSARIIVLTQCYEEYFLKITEVL